MAIKIGDKVRFLNSVGGGVVRRFVSKEVVAVEENDGFETPVLIRECVVIEGAAEAKLSEQNPKADEPLKSIAKSDPPKLTIKETVGGDQITLVLAFLPMNIKTLQNTSYEAYLVNDSNYMISFTYLNKVGIRWNLRVGGTVEPHQNLFLEEFTKEELNDLDRIALQYLPFKMNKGFELKRPNLMEYKLDLTRFYKLHCFKENDYFEDEAIIVPIVLKDKLQCIDQFAAITPDELSAAMLERRQSEPPARRQAQANQAERNAPLKIDLHIHELIDTTAGMNNGDILELQLTKVKETMEAHKLQKGKKIVFIHGKGDGVLRSAVLKLIKEKYRSCFTQDASFKEFGFGATMVTIR